MPKVEGQVEIDTPIKTINSIEDALAMLENKLSIVRLLFRPGQVEKVEQPPTSELNQRLENLYGHVIDLLETIDF